ncbi:MAG: hypothetical protein JKY31_02285 [Rhodobacteraceae bacterium]|nr:hypothetical protein [Paracoccaceae bacterium]
MSHWCFHLHSFPRNQGVSPLILGVDSIGVTADLEMANGMTLGASFIEFSGAFDLFLTAVSVDYNFDNGFAVGAEVMILDNTNRDMGFGISLSKSFGGGVTFDRRNLGTNLRGW